MRMFWRLEKLFWVGVISMVVVFSTIAIAKANPPALAEKSATSQHTTQVWSGWVGKVEKKGSSYTLAVGEPPARVYTLKGNMAEFQKFAGEMVKVQGNLSGTTLNVTNMEPHGR